MSGTHRAIEEHVAVPPAEEGDSSPSRRPVGRTQGESGTAQLQADAISQTACRIFRERGYHATSMRALSSALGVQPAALYYYYPSKEELLFHIMDRAIDALMQRVHGAVDPEAPARDQLQQAMRAHITTVAGHLDELSVFLHEMKSLRPEWQEIIQVKRDRYEHLFREILNRGIVGGQFTTLDSRLGGFMILAACNWLYNWFRPDGEYSPDQIASAFCDLMLHGVLHDRERVHSEPG